jgi:hypothetical protein
MEFSPMSTPSHVKVFFEPVMEQHSPGLYDAAETAASTPFEQAVTDDGRASYDADGFLVVSGVFTGEEIERGKNELEAMTWPMIRAAIWFVTKVRLGASCRPRPPKKTL